MRAKVAIRKERGGERRSKSGRFFGFLAPLHYLCTENQLISMNIQQVAEALERFAPLPLQEDYDNAGLQIGLTAAEDVSGVLLCLDVTENVVREAVAKHCNMIVAHHPLIFRPLRHLTGQTQVERCVAMALQKGVAVYAAAGRVGDD